MSCRTRRSPCRCADATAAAATTCRRRCCCCAVVAVLASVVRQHSNRVDVRARASVARIARTNTRDCFFVCVCVCIRSLFIAGFSRFLFGCPFSFPGHSSRSVCYDISRDDGLPYLTLFSLPSFTVHDRHMGLAKKMDWLKWIRKYSTGMRNLFHSPPPAPFGSRPSCTVRAS